MRSRTLYSSLILAAISATTWSQVPTAPGAPAPKAAPAQAPAAVSPDYKLGPEDVINVTVLLHPEYSSPYYVPQAGIVQFIGVLTVDVRNMSLSELQTKLTAAYKKRLRMPEVFVTLTTPRVQRLYVVGDVMKVGVVDFKPGWNVADILSAAGGLMPEIARADVDVHIERPGVEGSTDVHLVDALSHPERYPVESGDLVRIETVDVANVYITGRVSRPGIVHLPKDQHGILQALAAAGGVRDDASIANVRVTHSDGTDQVLDLSPAIVKGQKLDAPDLRSGDTVLVAQQLNSVIVLGYVNRPGEFPLPDGRELHLTDAISLASGPTSSRGRLTHVALLRQVDGKLNRTVYDVSKYMTKADLTQNPLIKPGDIVYVPETNRPADTTIVGALAAVGVIVSRFVF